MFYHQEPESAVDAEQSLAIRAAWLAYVGGHTQEEIAERLGITRVKVQRLVASAMKNGLVKFFVEGVPAECLALEDELMQRFGLDRCVVVPDVDDGTQPPESTIASLASAAARYLHRLLGSGTLQRVGIGQGRTLAAMVERLPSLQLPGARFVSLLGSLTRRSSANPFDVIAKLAERTGGECYFMPVPFIADSVADAEVLRAQRGVQDVFRLARECQLCVVGIADLTPATHLLRSQSLTPAELKSIRAAGAVGELAGRFIAADGSLIAHEMNARAVGVGLDELRGRPVLAVAGGKYKAESIRAVLRTGVLTALIVDEATAKAVLRTRGSGAAAGTRSH
ncbi:sugar-binding transcriptional regulator [Verminephrobacter aporrectodeae subsp. tuberculatae]|nr:sugar-binding transcriptional regulator [Verminephrobacter aporrectodeae subsp. tuberculatae]MCW8168622.1 sugar-binding transcriptional regulator [Verminephrobacter aporrectodeae subsp. tuberculatae]